MNDVDYARFGLPLLPIYPPGDVGGCSCSKPGCKNPAKHPIGSLTPNGLNDATIDTTVIEQWRALWPDMNIAIRSGVVSGIVVLDIDPASGGDKASALLETQHGPWPMTWTAITGRDGWHLYFKHPGVPIPNSAGKLGSGIDVRGDGAYALAPPSCHVSGKVYEWADGFGPDDLPLAPLPTWIVAAIRQRESAESARLTADEVVTEGGRNNRLTQLGGLLRRDGLTESEIRCALMAVNGERCRPPLVPAEVEKIAQSVARYPTGIHSIHAIPISGGVNGMNSSAVVLPSGARFQGGARRVR